MQNICHKFNDLQLGYYERNMNCYGCFYRQYNVKCKVKKSIINFIVKYGVPVNLKTKTLTDR